MTENSPESKQTSPRPRLIVGALGVLAAVVLLSWWVGHQDTKPGFGWELASIFGTAVGTIGLGPAVRLRVMATYDEPDHQPRIDPWMVPAITPGQGTQFNMQVRFEAQPRVASGPKASQ